MLIFIDLLMEQQNIYQNQVKKKHYFLMELFKESIVKKLS